MIPHALTDLPASVGTYALLFYSDHSLPLAIGRLGDHNLPAGWLIYIGSAHGPGGLRARVGRHLRQDKRVHWHIDVLTMHASIREVWWRSHSDRLECNWAAAVGTSPGAAIPVARFGSSDCRCKAHLFSLPDSALSPAWQSLDQPDRLVLAR